MIVLKNTKQYFGLVSVLLHWLSAIAVIGLFALGLWMTGLQYYDPWYRDAPMLHKGIGVIFIFFLFLRLCWNLYNPTPESPPNAKRYEMVIARIVHFVLYFMLFLMLPTGYLVTTAKGHSLDVLGWFEIPSIVTGKELNIQNLESVALELHEIIAFSIIGLASLHALAALKHHFFDKDNILKRMLYLK